MLDTSFSSCGCPICALGASSTFQLNQASVTQSGATAGSFSAYAEALFSGYQWTSSTITYSFPTSGSAYGDVNNYGMENEPSMFAPLPDAFKAAAHFSLSAEQGGAAQAPFSVEAFTNLKIQFTTDHAAANIRIAQSGVKAGDAAAWAYLPMGNPEAGDVWFVSPLTEPKPGAFDWSTMIHEIGHALGLSHPHDGPSIMPLDMDGLEFAIMSYRSFIDGPLEVTTEPWGQPQTWMMLDIAALQAMYGANFTPNEGEVIYSWTPDSGNTYVNGEVAIEPGANRIFATIWDGGGNVTYDLSAYSTGVQIDMRPGKSSTFSEVQLAGLGEGKKASGNIYNGLLYNDDPRSLIQKVIGGSGDDHIVSNDADNVIVAGDGNDTVILHGGNNQVWAGAGDTGNDYLVVEGHGNSTLGGGAGNDTLIVQGDGDNVLFGGADDDLIQINGNGKNTAWAGTGQDVITVAGGGNNTVGGGAGDDSITLSGGGNNIVYGGTGSDTITITGNGDNQIFGGGLNPGGGMTSNQIILNGSGANEVFNGAGNDVVTLNAGATGNNILWGSPGDDLFHFTAASASGTVKFVAGNGNDTIKGFDLSASQFIDVTGLFASAAQVHDALSSAEPGVSVLTISPGQSVTIDVALADLQAAPVENWLIV